MLRYFLKKKKTTRRYVSPNPSYLSTSVFRFVWFRPSIDSQGSLHCEGSPRRDSSKRIRPQYLIVALVIIGEGEVGGRHLVLLRPPAAHSAIGKISISEPPTPLRDRAYQFARLVFISPIGVVGTIRRRAELNRPDRKQRGGDRAEGDDVREIRELWSRHLTIVSAEVADGQIPPISKGISCLIRRPWLEKRK